MALFDLEREHAEKASRRGKSDTGYRLRKIGIGTVKKFGSAGGKSGTACVPRPTMSLAA